MKRWGTEFRGDPDDPCEVVKYYRKFQVEAERFDQKPHVIAYNSARVRNHQEQRKAISVGRKYAVSLALLEVSI